MAEYSDEKIEKNFADMNAGFAALTKCVKLTIDAFHKFAHEIAKMSMLCWVCGKAIKIRRGKFPRRCRCGDPLTLQRDGWIHAKTWPFIAAKK